MKNLKTKTIEILNSECIRLVNLVEIEFEAGTVCMTDSCNDVTFGQNLLQYSENFSKWNKFNVNVNTSLIESPDETSNTYQFAYTGNGYVWTKHSSQYSLADRYYNFSVWLWADTPINNVNIYMYDNGLVGGASGISKVFNITTTPTRYNFSRKIPSNVLTNELFVRIGCTVGGTNIYAFGSQLTESVKTKLYSKTDGTAILDNKVYYATAGLIGISGAEESAQIQGSTASVSLSGIPEISKNLVLSQEYIGNYAKIMGVFCDENWQPLELFDNPYLIFEGSTDSMSFADSLTSASISLNLINTWTARFEQKRGLRTSPDEWKHLFPSDTIMDGVIGLNAKTIEIYF